MKFSNNKSDKWFAKDKWYHFIVCFWGALIMGRTMYVPAISKEVLDGTYYLFPIKYQKKLNKIYVNGSGFSYKD